MLVYEFETVVTGFSGYGMINGPKYASRDHQKVILERCKNGWRYIGFIPTVQRATGHIQEMDLVFEKEE